MEFNLHHCKSTLPQIGVTLQQLEEFSIAKSRGMTQCETARGGEVSPGASLVKLLRLAVCLLRFGVFVLRSSLWEKIPGLS